MPQWPASYIYLFRSSLLLLLAEPRVHLRSCVFVTHFTDSHVLTLLVPFYSLHPRLTFHAASVSLKQISDINPLIWSPHRGRSFSPVSPSLKRFAVQSQPCCWLSSGPAEHTSLWVRVWHGVWPNGPLTVIAPAGVGHSSVLPRRIFYSSELCLNGVLFVGTGAVEMSSLWL